MIFRSFWGQKTIILSNCQVILSDIYCTVTFGCIVWIVSCLQCTPISQLTCRWRSRRGWRPIGCSWAAAASRTPPARPCPTAWARPVRRPAPDSSRPSQTRWECSARETCALHPKWRWDGHPWWNQVKAKLKCLLDNMKWLGIGKSVIYMYTDCHIICWFFSIWHLGI